MKVYHRADGEVLSCDDKTAAVFEWAQSIGVKVNPKLKYPVRFVPGYIGVQTSEDLSPCEELLSAPNAAMLSTKLMNHPDLEVVYSQHPKFFSLPDRAHEDNRMIVYCLWQQSLESESFWNTYLKFLPKDVETIIDWNDLELDELQDKDFEYDSRFRRERDFKGNTELGEILKGFPLMFKAEYLELNNINWIWKILCTRSYGRCIPFNSLIPVADLFNHDNVNTVYFYALQTESTPDANNEALETDYEDSDDPLVESSKPLLVSSLKLLKLSFTAFEELTAEGKEKHAELLTQARVEDSQAFVKSKELIRNGNRYEISSVWGASGGRRL